MPIPQSKYVDITSAVASTSAVANKELILRVLTKNPAFAYNQVYEFTQASDVGVFAGYQSTEYAIANAYFGWVSKKATSPKKISFYRYNFDSTAPFVTGVTPENVAQLTKVSDGSLTVYLGSTSYTINVDLTNAISYADIATILQTAIRENTAGGALYTQATVQFANGSFIITGGVTGSNDISLPTGKVFTYNAYPVVNTTIEKGYTYTQGNSQSYVPELTQIITADTLNITYASPSQWTYTGVNVTSYEVQKENQTGYTTVTGVQGAYVTQDTQIYLDSGCTSELALASENEWTYVANATNDGVVTTTVYNVESLVNNFAYTSTVPTNATVNGYTTSQTANGQYVAQGANVINGVGQSIPAQLNEWKANGETALAYTLKNTTGNVLYSKVYGASGSQGANPLYTDIRCENEATGITETDYTYTGASVTTYNVEAVQLQSNTALFTDSTLITPLTSDLTYLYYNGTVTNSVDFAQELGFTSNATVSNGLEESTINQILDNMADLSSNFLTFGFVDFSDAYNNIEACGAWVDNQNNQYRYCFDLSPINYSEGIALANKYTGLTATYNINYGSGVPAWVMSAILPATTNYNAVNGVKSYMFQQFPTFPVSVGLFGDGTLYQTLDNLNINYNGQTQKSGSLISFYQDGFNTNGVDTAIYDNEAWLKDSISTDILNSFMGLDFISADKSGRTILTSILSTNCEKALNNHVFALGKILDMPTQAYITQLTNDENAWIDVQNNGYWYTIDIQKETINGKTKYIGVYTLIYSKNDTIRKVEGSDILI